MTVQELVRELADSFRAAGLETPHLDATILCSEVLGLDKAALFARFTDAVPAALQTQARELATGRLAGKPVSYLLGRKEFYGRMFFVDKRVLVPRPDTETLIEAVLQRFAQGFRGTRIHDCCTGSGCIAITLAAELATHQIDASASDLSEAALQVCKSNSSHLLGREIACFQSDLLAGVSGSFDIITANPPYVTSAEWSAMQKSGWPEPALALDGGIDGLDLYRRLIPEAAERLSAGGWLYLEAADPQADTIAELCRIAGLEDVTIHTDLGGKRRVTEARKPE